MNMGLRGRCFAQAMQRAFPEVTDVFTKRACFRLAVLIPLADG